MKETLIPGEEKNIYDRWVKPEDGLNDAFGKRWWARPVGDSPELMPLDNSLNQDIHESVRRLVDCCICFCFQLNRPLNRIIVVFFGQARRDLALRPGV